MRHITNTIDDRHTHSVIARARTAALILLIAAFAAGTAWISTARASSAQATLPSLAAVATALMNTAVSNQTGGHWDYVDAINETDPVWIPDDICDHTWDETLEISTAVYKDDGDQQTPLYNINGDEYYGPDQEEHLLGEWQHCHEGGDTPLPSPTVPPDFPPGFDPTPPPSGDEFPCPGPGCLPGDFPPGYVPPGCGGDGDSGSCETHPGNCMGLPGDFPPNPPADPPQHPSIDPPPSPFPPPPNNMPISGPATTSHPVSFSHGYKMESAIDMRVSLPGRDFLLRRAYSSQWDMYTSPNSDPGLVGYNWSLNVFQFIHVDSNNSITIATTSGGTRTFDPDDVQTPTRWDPVDGYSQQYIDVVTVNQEEMYELHTPGRGKVRYYKTGSKAGLVYQEIDLYGNTNTYEYGQFGTNSVNRLTAIYLNGSSSQYYLKVVLAWTDGRVTSATLKKSDNTELRKVVYTYATAALAAVGSAGDLIQVACSTKVDRAPDNPDWYTMVTQYRYHRNSTPFNGGRSHQLRAVFLPAQIEYEAQLKASSASSATWSSSNLVNFATGLLLLGDTDETFSGTGAHQVISLAAKIIPEYEPATTGRVLQQQLQSACGCGGSSTQGIQLEYEYPAYTDTTYKRSMIMKSFKRGSNGQFETQPYQTNYYDLVSPSTNAGIFFLANSAMADADSHIWVVHLNHNNSGLVTKSVSTSAVGQSYTPPSEGSAPSIDIEESDGLIQERTYNSHGQVTSIGLRKGETGHLNIINKFTYDATRWWAVASIVDYTIEDLGNGNENSSSNTWRTVEYKYDDTEDAQAPILWVERKYSAETASENGPGGYYYTDELFDSSTGLNIWSRTADDVLVKRTFGSSGLVESIEVNADGDGIATHSSTSGVTWDGRNSEGGSLITTYERDDLGRITSITQPNGAKTRFSRELRTLDDSGFSDNRPYFLYYALVTLPPKISDSPLSFAGPAMVNLMNAAGKTIAMRDYSLVADSQNTYGTGYAFKTDAQLSRSTIQHSLSGLVTSTNVWHSLAQVGDNGGVYETTYQYDVIGRLEQTTEPNGNITKYTYDARNRIIEVQAGTNSLNMVTLADLYYDSGGSAAQGVGDGYLTYIREYTGETSGSERNTILTYDYRGRVTTVQNPDKPHAFFVYDNMDRIVKVALFEVTPPSTDINDSNTLGDRSIYAEIGYGQRGLPYVQRIAIDPTQSSPTFLEKHTWYDANRRVVGQWGPNAPGVKISYTPLGQVAATYLTDRGGDTLYGSGSFADVYDTSTHSAKLTGDVVFEQTNFTYREDKGLLDLLTTRARTHDADDSKTGDLASFAGGANANYAITTFRGAEYDKAGRVVYVTDFGTNSSSGFVAGGTAPSLDSNDPARWSSLTGDEIVDALDYDNHGRIKTVTDPMNKITMMLYDDLDREIATVENAQFNSGTPEVSLSWNGTSHHWDVVDSTHGDIDEDRVTSIAYRLTENEIDQVAHDFNGGSTDTPQVTRYLLGNDVGSTSEDLLKVNGVVRRIVYPDVETGESEADHSVDYTYNRLGELRYTRDQNNTTHTISRDLMGRITSDEASVDSGGPIDGTVTKITTAYDGSGRPISIQSLAGTTVKNEVQFDYTKLWQLQQFTQEPLGAVSGSSKQVTYAYTTAAVNASGVWLQNISRPASLNYPDGSLLNIEYDTPMASGPGSGSRASRPMALSLGATLLPTWIAQYSYIGMGTVASVDYPVPDVTLDRSLAHSGSRTTGSYPGFDRFGRIARQIWADGDISTGTGGNPSKPPLVELAYEYNKAGDITEKYDNRPGAKRSQNYQYQYDDLHRLIAANKGLNHGGSFTQSNSSQQWNLSVIGNWNEFDTDLNADGQYQSTHDKLVGGTFNFANEITQLDQNDPNGYTGTLAVTYDKAGNLREQGIGTNAKLRFTHDAWNRLVKVQYVDTGTNPETVIARGEYEYNGLHQRCIQRCDHDTSDLTTGLDEQRLLYYSAGWQVLEERIDDAWTSGGGHSTDRIVQHIWGLRYIDDLVLTRQDYDLNGDYANNRSDYTHYALSDHQFSVVAMIDSSAKLLERVSYTPNGAARHQFYNDIDGDGDVDANDNSLASNASGSTIGQSNYNVDADFDRDGDVDSNDTVLAGSTYYKSALPAGWISAAGNGGNAFGYCGYRFNQETGLYLVRFRNFDPANGRWLERDPAGYVDSMSLYGYGWGSTLIMFDPFGMTSIDNRFGRSDDFWQWWEQFKQKNPGTPDIESFEDAIFWEGEYRKEMNGRKFVKDEGLRRHRRGAIDDRFLGLAAIAAAWLAEQGIATVQHLSQSRAYRMLIAALERGDTWEADRWSEELYLELVEAGLPYVGLDFKTWWDEDMSPRLMPLRYAHEKEFDPPIPRLYSDDPDQRNRTSTSGGEGSGDCSDYRWYEG